MLRVFQHRNLNVKILVDQRCPLKSQILNAETTFVNYDRKVVERIIFMKRFLHERSFVFTFLAGYNK